MLSITNSPLLLEAPTDELLGLLNHVWGESRLVLRTREALGPPFGPWIRERRIASGWCIMEAAYRAAMAPIVWRDIEQGAVDPNVAQVIEMARALGADAPHSYRLSAARPTSTMYADPAQAERLTNTPGATVANSGAADGRDVAGDMNWDLMQDFGEQADFLKPSDSDSANAPSRGGLRKRAPRTEPDAGSAASKPGKGRRR